MLCIVVRYEDQTIRWPVPEQGVTIGAANDNDFVLPFPGVSRRHAALEVEGKQVRLIDLQSKNGLIAGGRRIDQVVLGPGDAVQIGRAMMSLEDARTSDVELALQLDASPVKRRKGEATSSGSARAADVSAALRAIRLGESGLKFSGRRRSLWLEECRSALNARAMLLCHVRNDGEIEIATIAGPMPDQELLAAGASALPRRSRKWQTATRTEGRDEIVVAGRQSDFVMAILRAGANAPWVHDFVTFIAEKLIGASPELDTAEIPLVAEDGLSIPSGMVVGSSPAMTQLMQQLKATVASGMDVLLLGETGTGKELIARLVHASGPTADGPFLAINCAAIPSELLEAELFGVQGRVATGVDPRPGMFLQADGGSVFLDEIGEMAERLQAKILRVLQEREVLALGAPRPRRINVRVISASNRDLSTLIAQGRFRPDLYYRLRGLQFHIPPLRDRKEDIAPLVFEFLTRASSEYRKTIRGITRSALRLLEDHDWPGNVRELESEVRRAVLVCPDGASLQAEHFSTVAWQIERRTTVPQFPAVEPMVVDDGEPEETGSLRDRVDAIEREEIERALRAAGGNRSQAARALGITRNGLALKLKRLGIGRD